MLQDLKRAVVLRPDDPDARFALGEALLLEGQASAAATQLEKALELEPRHDNARRVLVRAYLADGRTTVAEALLRPAVDEGDPGACDDLADLYLRIRRPDDALLALVAATRRDPDDVDRRLRIAEGLIAMNLPAQAREHLEVARRLAPGDARVRTVAKGLAELEGDLAGASTSPLSRGPDYLVGRALAAARELDAAGLEAVVEALRARDPASAKRALVTAPPGARAGFAFAWLRADVATALGDLDVARRAREDALARAPDDRWRARAHARLGELALARGDAPGARDAFAASVGLLEEPDVLEALGDAHALAGDGRGAEEAYGRAARIDPGSTAATKLAAARARRKHGALGAGVGRIGVLGWNGHGGRVSPAEVMAVSGRGELVVTGNVGASGQEAAKVAHSCAKARARELGFESRATSHDVHVHFSDTELAKDGASSGLALALAIVSALRGEALVPDLGATGEITVQGVVRPVAGLHEKLVAACLGGLRVVLLPRKNVMDVRDIPAEVRRRVTIHAVDSLPEALELALGLPPSGRGV